MDSTGEQRKKLLVQDRGRWLSDAQLLELALRYAEPDRDASGLVRGLLEQFDGLSGLLTASREDLTQAADLSGEALEMLSLLSCLAQGRGDPDARPVLDSIQAWIDYLQPLLLGQRREQIYLLCLDGDARLKECAFLGEGSDCLVRLDLGQVCALARRSGATAVVLTHSHPSGLALPSHADIVATRACRAALAEQDIVLLDHLIFADDECVSMAQSGLL